ncbi:tetratricopeptide repeat protein [Armatimonas sp.]|uniref:J domain-containing protein n=1 Tax=Armatimonas sp. TaxID=1872638 RepID=UPI00286CEAB1|nr:tetratricopeptide repeat protein [Armatimonas sp.]
MSEIVGEETLYTILEVSESATEDEIQQGYFRLVRLYPPQKDPERYQLLNSARETLLNPQRRGEYDQSRRNGTRVRVLVDQAALAMEKDPQKSLSLLKSAVTLAPDMPRPRMLLAQLLIRTKNYDLAERQYAWQIRRAPHDETLRCKMARCLMLQSKNDEAERELKAVLELNEAHYDAQLLLARIYRSQSRIPELIAALEQAIAADEQENFADFSALLQLLMVYIQNDHHDGAENTSRRLLAVIPEERYEQAAIAFLQTAELFFREDHFVWTRHLLFHVQNLPLADDHPCRLKMIELAQKSALQHEAQHLAKDDLLFGGLQDCFRTLYRDHSSDSIRESRMNAAFAKLQREFESTPRQLLKQLAYIRREYPLISADQEPFLGLLCQRALNRQTALDAQAVQRAAMASSFSPLTVPVPSQEETKRSGLFGRLMGSR